MGFLFASRFSATAIRGTVRLVGLPPDDCTLEVIVPDSRGQPRQQIEFIAQRPGSIWI